MLSFKSTRERGKSPFNETLCTLFFNNNGLFHVKFKACSSLANRFLAGSHNQKQYNWHMSVCSDPSFQTQQRTNIHAVPTLGFEKSKLSSSCNCPNRSHQCWFTRCVSQITGISKPACWWGGGSVATTPSQPGCLLPSARTLLLDLPCWCLTRQVAFVYCHTRPGHRAEKMLFAFISCSPIPGWMHKLFMFAV